MLKSIMLFILFAILALVLIGILFVNLAPQFGAVHDKVHKDRMTQSSQYKDNAFVNQIDTQTSTPTPDSGGMIDTLFKFIKGVPNQKPSRDIDVIKLQAEDLDQSQAPELVWFGHSSFLLQVAGKTVFFDPMFSQKAAPHPWLGGNRYNKEFPLTPEQLPNIDAIVISHDHYDHLDYDSVLQLDHKVANYYVPLGVASHLISWGINKEKITEFDWWQNQDLGNLQLTFTPARHFSGRRITNQNQTLWGGWYVKSEDYSVFFSGDTGYGPHFSQIKEKLGEPDFALLECGQYNTAWADIHMMPEQTVQAAKDLNAKVMMPVHWGAFTLALHSWTDPIERAMAEANKQQQAIVAPEIGELMTLQQEPTNRTDWWTNY